jgi:hypothetical protein
MEQIIKQLNIALQEKLDHLTFLNIRMHCAQRLYDREMLRFQMMSCVSDIQLIRNAIDDLSQLITP